MNAKRRHIDADEPLWLVVQYANCSQCFEFSSTSTRPVIIGSSETADIRVAEAAPIACFLERDDASLWVIPADPTTVLVLDTVTLAEKCRVYTHGLLEVAGVELRLKVRDTPPTLRADRVRTDSEICGLRPEGSTSAIDSLAATTTIDSSALRAALARDEASTISIERSGAVFAASTKTVEMDPIDFDAWFDDAIASAPEPTGVAAPVGDESGPITPNVVRDVSAVEETGANVNVQPEAKTQEPSTSEPSPTSHPRAEHPMVPHLSTPGTPAAALPSATAAMAQMAPAEVHADGARGSLPALELDPYQTIEISRALFAEPSSSPVRSVTRSDTPQAPATAAGVVRKSGDTTEFDVLVTNPVAVVPALSGSAHRARSVHSAGAEFENNAVDSTPKSAVAAAPKQSRREFENVNVAAAPKEGRGKPITMAALERIGVLTKQRPLLVIGGAAVGSLILVMFLLGVAHLLGARTDPTKPQTRPEGQAASAASVTGSSATPAKAGPSDANATEPEPAPTAPEAVSNPVPASIKALPDASMAVGHLFAGRLPEAEQAYRDLSARYPDDPAFRAAARILTRRNAPACRAGSATSTSCPMVKP